LHYPQNQERQPESQLPGVLAWAHEYLHSLAEPEGTSADLGADFEHLRWFELPAVCVSEPAP